MKRRILGIDPGLCKTGWGIIDIEAHKLFHVAHGTIQADPKNTLEKRLKELHQRLSDIITQYQPEEAAIEETFLNTNPNTTLKLGMARGALMLAPALHNIPLSEYSANHIKKNVVGAGHAGKEQVAMMVQTLLPKASPVKDDPADALAIAICHAHTAQTHKRMQFG